MTTDRPRLLRLVVDGDRQALRTLLVEARRANLSREMWDLLELLPLQEDGVAPRRDVLRALLDTNDRAAAWWLYADCHLRSLGWFGLGPELSTWRSANPEQTWQDATHALRVLMPDRWERWLLRGRIRLEKHTAAALLVLATEGPLHREALVDAAAELGTRAGVRVTHSVLFDVLGRVLTNTGVFERTEDGRVVLGSRLPMVPPVGCPTCLEEQRCPRCASGDATRPHWSMVLPPRR